MQETSLVILIDDDEISNFINEAIIKTNLSKIEIKSFIDPTVAIKFIKNTHKENPKPILIFLDINMPQISGWEVLEELAKIERLDQFIKVVMISSSIDPTDKKKSLEYPVVIDFVAKPLSNELVNKLIH